MRSWLERLAAVVVVALVTGCATVPTTGPVQSHSPRPPQVNSGVEVAPAPPPVDASPLLVVEGFLHAMATYQPNYDVARSYLTDAASRLWKPESGVQIYADGYPPTETQRTVILVAPVIGALDSGGGYRATDDQVRHDFGLVRNGDGQWRISRPPRGLLVSRYLFLTGFASVDLHFFADTGDTLVPDPRFVPSGSRALSAALEAQLAGPSTWLEPAVRKPATTGLELESVTVDGQGVAEINLAGERVLNAEQRRRLAAELAFTATQLDGVLGIRVRARAELWRLGADGTAVVSEHDFAAAAPVDPAAAHELFAVKSGRVQRVTEGTQGVQFSPLAPGLTRPTAVAVRGDAAVVAGVIEAGTRLQATPVAIGQSRVVASGRSLLRPQYARNGELWTADTRSGFLVSEEDGAVRVQQQGLPSTAVSAFRLAPDGVRLVAVLKDGGKQRLGLIRIVRSGGGVSLEGWRPINVSTAGGSSDTILDVGWSTATELLVLATGRGGATSVLRLDQDSASVSDIGPNNAMGLVEISAAPGRPALVRSSEGLVYRFNGEFNWGLSIMSVDAVTYSG